MAAVLLALLGAEKLKSLTRMIECIRYSGRTLRVRVRYGGLDAIIEIVALADEKKYIDRLAAAIGCTKD